MITARILCLFFCVCFCGRAFASWPVDTATNLPVCALEGDQHFPVLVPDGSDGCIVFWQDGRNGNSDIYAQRLDIDGNSLWQAGGIPICEERGNQGWPEAISDGQGGAIVVWGDSRHGDQDIYAQRVDADGNLMWVPEGIPVCVEPTLQEDICVVAEDAGGAMIGWEDWRNGNQDIYAQRVAADGHPLWNENGIPVAQLPGDQYDPVLCVDTQGGVIAVWWDIGTPDWDIYAQRLSSEGNPLWGNGVLVCNAPGNQGGPLAVPDTFGGAIVVWTDYREDVMGDLYAQRLDANGSLRWQSDGLPVCALLNAQQQPTAISDGQGGAIVTWWDERDRFSDIYAQRLGADGQTLWQPGGLPISLAEGVQREPQIISAGETACILWTDFRADYGMVVVDHIYAQRVDLAGNLLWEEDGTPITTAEGEQSQPRAIWLPSGYVVVWADQRGGHDSDIFANKIPAR